MDEKIKVLLVEDNRADVDLIREILPENGPVSFFIETVSRLSEAIKRLETGGIDLILLDLGLPDSQGIETFNAVKESVPRIPIIVLSGNADQEVAVAAVKGGAQDYLVKGEIGGGILARSARYAMERKRGELALEEQNARLDRFNRATVDREVRMIELKKEANALLKAAGHPEKYRIVDGLE